ASSEVVIPGTPTNQPQISTTAVAKSVVVNSGASLSLTAAGSLTINGSSGVGLYLYFQASVDNAGAIVIGNTAAVAKEGIFSDGTFTNQAGATIQIDRTGGS